MSDSRTLLLIADVLACTTSEELSKKMGDVAQSFGFEYALYGVRVALPGVNDVLQHIESGYPEEYQRLYADKNFIERDPTVAHALTDPSLILWGDAMYTPESFEVMEESRRHGLGYGLSAPVHQGAGIRGILSLARDQHLKGGDELVTTKAGATVLANAVHVAMTRIVWPKLTERRHEKLNKREHDCLQLAALGKSNAVISDILNLSEGTVKFHMTNLLTKLGVSTRQQAIALGVALGLVT